MKKTLVICDIDSTIADIDDFLGFIVTKPKNWDAFYASIPNHKPIMPTVNLIRLMANNPLYEVVFLTARSDTCRQATFDWLQKQFIFPINLFMRKAGDFRKNFHVKEEVLFEHFLKPGSENTYESYIAFEDDPNTVKMFRELGFTCYDVGYDFID